MEWCPSQDLGQGLLRFQDPETSSYVDWDTASKVIVRTDMGVGSTRKYSRFTGFTDYPNESTGGVVACPGFVAHAKLKGDNCESLVVYLILSAEFPPVVPDAEFEIPAPVGTTAVLFAPSSMSEVNAVDKVQADRGPVADARTLVPELLAQESENLRRKENLQQATQRTGIRPWFFWANVVGIVLLVVGCVRVSRQRKNGMNTDAKGG